jgi:hypothetical protein
MSAVFSFLDSHLDQLGLLHQLADTGSILRQNHTPKLFEQMHKVRKIFDGVSFAFAIANFVQICAIIEGKWGILSALVKADPIRGTICALGLPAAPYIGAAFAVVYLVNRFFRPTQNLQELLPDGVSDADKAKIKVTWDRSESQQKTQLILAARIFMNLTLGLCAANPYFFLASAALQTGSLITTAQWKLLRYDRTFEPLTIVALDIPIVGQTVCPFVHWIKNGANGPVTNAVIRVGNNDLTISITQEGDDLFYSLLDQNDREVRVAVEGIGSADNLITHLSIPAGYNLHRLRAHKVARALHDRLNAVTFSYFRPMLSAMGNKNEVCAICQDEEFPPTTLACKNHAVHVACMIRTIYADMERFDNLALFMWDKHLRLVGLPIRHIDRGRATHVSYKFNLSQAVFPRCGSCRNQPGYGEIEISTTDQEFPSQKTAATVSVYDPAPAPRPVA